MIESNMMLRETIDRAVAEAQITDVHTHLYSPSFGDMLLWGIDELVTYHYLIAETFRWLDIPYEDFWEMDKLRPILYGKSYLLKIVHIARHVEVC